MHNGETKRELKQLGKNKLITIDRKKFTVAACGGVFDLLHPGHVFFLEKAKEFGDILVVIVARDSTAAQRKRVPTIPEAQRVQMVSALRPVDFAVLGGEGDFLRIIEEIRPDTIVLGPDQNFDESKLTNELAGRGLKVNVKRVREHYEGAFNSTTRILREVRTGAI